MTAGFAVSRELNKLVSATVNHLWQSSVIFGLVSLLAFLLRRHPARYRYGLWLVSSLKFLLPFALLSGIGSRLTATSSKIETPCLFSLSLAAATQPFEHDPPLAAPSHLASSAIIVSVIGLVWLIGACIVVSVWVARWNSLRRICLSASELSEGREAEALLRAASRMNQKARVVLLESAEALEPGVFGFRRASLLWPSLLSDHLDDVQIESIMCHELEHVRRGDNAAAFIHMLVSMIFWFHPAVWWVQQRLIQEREQACDEAVLGIGYASHTYADGLLRACRFCVTARLPCVSGVSGLSLKERVLRIAHGAATQRLTLTRKMLLLFGGCLILAVPVLSGSVQTIEAYNFLTLTAPPVPPPPPPPPAPDSL